MLNLQRLRSFIKGNVVFCIALFAALLTMLWVPPSIEYKEYFDFKTLTCLFCTLAVVCALRNINFFKILAHKIVRVFHSIRSCILAIVYITFIGSMLIANDMALITFLPLGFFVLKEKNRGKQNSAVCRRGNARDRIFYLNDKAVKNKKIWRNAGYV